MERSPQNAVQAPSWGMCHEAYDDRCQVADRDSQTNRSLTVSNRDCGSRGERKETQRTVNGTSHCVFASTRCTAAVMDARTDEAGYPDEAANCIHAAQDGKKEPGVGQGGEEHIGCPTGGQGGEEHIGCPTGGHGPVTLQWCSMFQAPHGIQCIVQGGEAKLDTPMQRT